MPRPCESLAQQSDRLFETFETRLEPPELCSDKDVAPALCPCFTNDAPLEKSDVSVAESEKIFAFTENWRCPLASHVFDRYGQLLKSHCASLVAIATGNWFTHPAQILAPVGQQLRRTPGGGHVWTPRVYHGEVSGYVLISSTTVPTCTTYLYYLNPGLVLDLLTLDVIGRCFVLEHGISWE